MRAAVKCDACGRADRQVVPVGIMVAGFMEWAARLCMACASDVLDAGRDEVRSIIERDGPDSVRVLNRAIPPRSRGWSHDE